MENIWEIDSSAAVIEYEEDIVFVSLDYGLHNKISGEQLKYTIFNGEGCQEESKEITIDSNYIVPRMTFEHSDVRAGSSSAEITLAVVADYNMILSSPFYKRVDENHGLLTFCVRFSVYSGEISDRDSMEVNSVETPVQLRIDLHHDDAGTVGGGLLGGSNIEYIGL